MPARSPRCGSKSRSRNRARTLDCRLWAAAWAGTQWRTAEDGYFVSRCKAVRGGMKKPGACAGPERPAPAAAENSRLSAVASAVGPARPHQAEGMRWRRTQQEGPRDFEKPDDQWLRRRLERALLAPSHARQGLVADRWPTFARSRSCLKIVARPRFCPAISAARNSWKAPEIWPPTTP